MRPPLKIVVIAVLSIGLIAIFHSCKKTKVPELTTKEATDITAISAISGGNVINNGGAEVTARGVCWSNAVKPTANSIKTSDGTGNGEFTSTITGLSGNDTYYVRAYAINSEGTGYGNEVSFETPTPIVIPTISTNSIASVTSTTAVSGGNITSDGGGNITARGVCWNTSGNPTITDNKTSNGTGIGNFSSDLTGLSDGTIYYVSAYASNGAGTAYGEPISFITPVTDIEGNIYKTVKIGTQIWMAENLKATKLNTGASITNVQDMTDWANADSPAYCWYENQSYYKEIYGAIYNWYPVNTGKICPVGWHIPYIEEWDILNKYVSSSAKKLRESGYIHWYCQEEGTNETGFTALPGGLRYSSEYYLNTTGFSLITKEIWFWSASIPQGDPQSFFIYCSGTQSAHNDSYKDGRYIRCVKN
jgi:uncharacterized protein (TIGR02145 family)